MSVGKAGERVDFQPEGSSYTYILRRPSVREAQLPAERAEAVAGGRQWYPFDVAREFREEFRLMVAAEPVGMEVHLEAVERWFEGLQSAMDEVRHDNTEESRAALFAALDMPREVARLERMVHKRSEPYRQVKAEQQAWPLSYGIAVVEDFLEDWHGEDLPPFERGKRGVPDELIDLIPQNDLVQIGMEFSRMLAPSDASRKNYRSASSGTSRPPSSTSTEVTRPRPNGRTRSGTSPGSASASSTSTPATS